MVVVAMVVAATLAVATVAIAPRETRAAGSRPPR
jgi:hypothetical protein